MLRPLLLFAALVTSATAAPLHDFAQNRELKKLQDCIERGKVDVNLPDETGRTALQIAAYQGHREIVQYLLSRKANPNRPDQDGSTPLQGAAWNGDRQMLELLLRSGAKVQGGGSNLLQSAILSRNGAGAVEVLKVLIQRGVNPKQLKDGYNLLHDACISSSLPQAEYLVRTLKFDVNAPTRDKMGNRPLHLVNDIETARWLIAQGAQVNAVNQEGRTPLFSAASDPPLTGFLIASGAKVNFLDQASKSPLYEAAAVGSLDTLRLLLKAGAKANLSKEPGASPLFAAVSGQPDSLTMLQLLIENGANPKEFDENGASLLHQTVLLGTIPMAQYLVDQHGLDVNEATYQNARPLHMAMLRPDMAKWLIAHGAQVNAGAAEGSVALHWACSQGKAETVEVLLKAGADRQVKDQQGMSPLQLATARLENERGNQGDTQETEQIIKLLTSGVQP